jgi:hypothetical protein
LIFCDKRDMARYWVKVVSRWSWWLWVITWFTLVEKKQCWKEIELIYEGKYTNSHIWIWTFVKWFKKFGKWYYWIYYSKTKLLQLDSF